MTPVQRSDMRIKLTAFAISIAVIFSLAGCSDGSGGRFRYDFSSPISNMDPQFTTDESAKTVIANCFEGLLRQNASGAVELACAETMDISDDGLVYTFTLREDLAWIDADGPRMPVTSQDFVFGLRRLFGPNSMSSYASEFSCIKNGRAVLEGIYPPEMLGISAPDNRTLVITLEEPYAFFERLLTTPAAMPCNQEFFLSTRGRYGLDAASVLCNGAFYIRSWNEERLTLARNEDAIGQVAPESVTFYIGRENTQQLLLDGKSDAGIMSLELLDQAADQGYSYDVFDNIVWAVAFNQQNEALADPQIRRALQMSLDRDRLGDELGEGYFPAQGVVPPSTMLYNLPYREAAGPALEITYMPAAALEMFNRSLSDLGMSQLRGLTLLVPDTSEHLQYAGLLLQMWQRNLAFYLNVEAVPEDQFVQRINTRNYDIAILPLRAAVPEPSGVLGKFVSQASDNVVSYRSEEYDSLITQAGLARR